MQGRWQPGGAQGGGGYGAPGAGYGGPYSAPPPNSYASQYGHYEFNSYENSIIDKTASRAKLWGLISAVIGVLQIFGSCGMVSNAMLAAYLPAGIVAVVVGLTFIGVGNSLKAVVTTQGNDVAHLMQALEKLSAAFFIEIVCAIVGFALAVVGIFLVLFVFVAFAATK